MYITYTKKKSFSFLCIQRITIECVITLDNNLYSVVESTEGSDQTMTVVESTRDRDRIDLVKLANR